MLVRSVRLKFANQYLGKDFWNNVLRTGESKIELFGHSIRNHLQKPKAAFDQKSLIPTVKHGGNVMVYGCLAASGPGQLAITELTMNSLSYQRVLEENVRPSDKKLKLKQWAFQQDEDPKHTSKSTEEWLKRKEWRVVKWSCQRPDLNPIKMVRGDF